MRVVPILKYAFTAAGLGLLGLAALLAASSRSFIAGAEAAEGTVVNLVASGSTDPTTYAPVVTFVAPGGARIEFTSSAGENPPRYARGQKVRVLYPPADPRRARIDGFMELWGDSAIVGGLGGTLFLLGVGILLTGAVRGRREEHLKRYGTRVETTLQSVEVNQWISVNDRHPFRIVSQWLNPATGKIHVFKSRNLWFDPTQYVRGQITVFVERGNPRRYHMDVSFLPRAR